MSGGRWNLNAHRLVLRDSVLDVVTVVTSTGPRPVLKFTARSVAVGDLDLAIKRDSATWHLQGDPGSTSTLAGDSVTMYAEELSGTITGLGDGPLPEKRTVTIAPDSVPQWLYGPDAAAPSSPDRTLVFEDATVFQARLIGGDLAIPGMRLNEVQS